MFLKVAMTPKWPLTPHLLGHMCVYTQESLFPSPFEILESVCTQWPIMCRVIILGSMTSHDLWPHMMTYLLRSYGFFFHIGIFTSETYWRPSKCAQMISFWTSWYNDLKWPLTPLIMWPCGLTRWSLHPSPICGAVFRDQVQPGPDFPLLWKVWAGLLLQPDWIILQI